MLFICICKRSNRLIILSFASCHLCFTHFIEKSKCSLFGLFGTTELTFECKIGRFRRMAVPSRSMPPISTGNIDSNMVSLCINVHIRLTLYFGIYLGFLTLSWRFGKWGRRVWLGWLCYKSEMLAKSLHVTEMDTSLYIIWWTTCTNTSARHVLG